MAINLVYEHQKVRKHIQEEEKMEVLVQKGQKLCKAMSLAGLMVAQGI